MTLKGSFIVERRRKRKRKRDRLKVGSQRSNVLFILSSDKDQRKNSLSCSLYVSVNEPLSTLNHIAGNLRLIDTDQKRFFLLTLSVLNVNIKLDSL